MLTKYKNVKPKKGVNKPLKKYLHICDVFRNFFRERAPKFDIFSGVVFSGRIILKHIENKKSSGRFSLENFDTVVALLVFFEQFSGKFCAPNFKCFTKCDAFCSYIFDYACSGVRLTCY